MGGVEQGAAQMRDVEQGLGIIVSLITIAGAVLAIMGFILKLFKDNLEVKRDITENRRQVGLIWRYLLDRGNTEAILKGFADMNSPLTLKPETRKLYEDLGLIDKLHNLYRGVYAKMGVHLTRQQLKAILAPEVQDKFGEILFKEICVKNSMDSGACVALAVEIALEEMPGA